MKRARYFLINSDTKYAIISDAPNGNNLKFTGGEYGKGEGEDLISLDTMAFARDTINAAFRAERAFSSGLIVTLSQQDEADIVHRHWLLPDPERAQTEAEKAKAWKIDLLP